MTTPNFEWDEIPSSSDADVPYRTNILARQIDATVKATDTKAAGAVTKNAAQDLKLGDHEAWLQDLDAFREVFESMSAWNCIEIMPGTDLDTLRAPGRYRSAQASTTSTLINSPTTQAFVMNVEKSVLGYTSQELGELHGPDGQVFKRNTVSPSPFRFGPWGSLRPPQDYGTVMDRMDDLEVLGGLAPGDTSDVTVKTLVANLASQTRAAIAAVVDTMTFGKFTPLINEHIGLAGKTNPVNAHIYIGTGTGTLTDAATSGVSAMGVKVKIDSPTGGTGRAPDGIQSDVNILTGSTDGSVRALMGRVDVNDTSANTGDTVGVWGDAWVTSASNRPTWGGNIYGSIRDGVAYAATMVGLEVGFENRGTLDNPGGGLHVVSHGLGKKGQFGLKISSDAAWGSAGTFKTHLMMGTDTAPSDNYVWIGALNPGNIPTGTPIMQLNAAGKMGIGAAPDATAPLKVGGRVIVGTATGPDDAVTKAQLDAVAGRSVSGYAPAAALAQTVDRRAVGGTAIPALTSGTMRLSAVWLAKGTVVTSATYVCGTAVAGLTNRWYAFFDVNRNLLRTTADNTAAWAAGATLTLPFSTTYTIPADGLYYVGICEVATTPTALRGVGASSNVMSLAPVLNGDSGTALTNAASTPATSPGAWSVQGSVPYAYVS